MENLGYLIAAYTAVWVVIAFYLFLLVRRNHRLNQQVTELEERLAELEKREELGMET